MILRVFLCFTAFVFSATCAICQTGNSQNPASSTANLFSEEKRIAPGKPFILALQLAHPKDWHSYYLHSGGVELPPHIDWELPAGFSAGPIQWPVPEVKDGFFGKSFVYSGSPIFLIEMVPPADLEIGKSVELIANAKWQICKESCINEEKSFSLTLPIAEKSEKDLAPFEIFETARKSLPVNEPSLRIAAHSRGSEIQLRIASTAAINGEPIDFIPNQPFVASASAGGKISREGNEWVIHLKRLKKDALDQPILQGSAISGILLGTANLLIPEVVIALPSAKSLPFLDYLPILSGMLLGGLILNLMPCVFPVIGLKIMGFVQQAGNDRRKIALHGVTFTLGVLASFGVLSGILFAARAASSAGASSIGWGYQLQNPWVVLTLMLLMFVLALNMFGIFEFGMSATSVGGQLQSKQGISGSFFSGVLATIVATPCSAPFLGVAIGAAIALPALQFFSAFMVMGLGLSLPYLILSMFPKLIDSLPRPGAWMESFKQAMSFLLFATAGYLLWVYAGQIQLENLLGPIFGLSIIAAACWIYGRWNLPHLPSRTRRISLVVTVIFGIGGVLLAMPPAKSKLVWETWSQERVDELISAGTPVYIDFTAQWCATCQVNKKVAYTADVIELMEQKGIIALKADKTSADPKIEEQLQELGRTAIPVNVLLVPGKEPIITREILSAGYLKELFTREIPSKNPRK